MAITLQNTIETQEGSGILVNRLFPLTAGFRHYDPFVLWDHFELEGGEGFPDHPHRGFEGVTYLLQGSMQHKDNLGNHSTVFAGGVQRFTAGKGIVHSEQPQATGMTEGIQLWVNLAQAQKHASPSYQSITTSGIPEEHCHFGRTRTVLGENSNIDLHTHTRVLDICLNPDHTFQVTRDMRGFIYVIDGVIHINQEHRLTPKQAAFFEKDDLISILTNSRSARFILAQGQPHGEPIFQRGPYVD